MNAWHLREIAATMGKTLPELATDLGLARRTIYDWVEQDRVPDVPAMLLVAVLSHNLSFARLRMMANLPLTGRRRADKSEGMTESNQGSLWI